MTVLSVVIPAWNEEKNVMRCENSLREKLSNANIEYEMIFVDDGSTDETWKNLKKIFSKNKKVRGIRLSRNFGKESAIFAGLDNAKGDCIAVIDCDLQHPPETLVEMYRVWQNNDVDIVEAKKKSRGKESRSHGVAATLFYKILRSTSGLDLENASDFKLMSRAALDELLKMPERLTFFRAMSSWIGFRTENVYFEVPDRLEGESRWSFRSLTKLALNAITSYSALPMQFVTFCGVITFLLSLVFGVNSIYMKISGRAVEGFTTVILLLLIIGSIIMMSLGVIGLYLSRIYEEVKYRPRYLISERLGE